MFCKGSFKLMAAEMVSATGWFGEWPTEPQAIKPTQNEMESARVITGLRIFFAAGIFSKTPYWHTRESAHIVDEAAVRRNLVILRRARLSRAGL